MTINLPKEYNHELTLQFLLRSPRELLHRVEGESIFKLLMIDGTPFLFKIEQSNGNLNVNFLNHVPSPSQELFVKQYIKEWFDLDSDLSKFYSFARKDDL